MEQSKKKYCVYLDIELAKFIKEQADGQFRSFSTFINHLMQEYKKSISVNSNIKVLKSESRN